MTGSSTARGLRGRLLAAAGLVAALLVTACSGGGDLIAETAEVTSGRVVETVAAPATIVPADRATVTAPAGGEIAELVVEDGARVRAGDVVVRLTSEDLDGAIARARAGIDAADAVAGVQPTLDLSPLFGTLGGTLSATVEPLLDALDAQAARIENADVRAEFERRLLDLRADYVGTVEDLAAAEREARAAADRATDAQRAAADVQRRQAEAALEAAETQRERLAVTAPITGRVEYASPDETSGAAGAGSLDGRLPPDVAGLLGGGGGRDGRVRPGARVAAGQALFTVYDLSSFHVAASVDEVDAVGVRQGQRATVFLEAYPDLELSGRVSRVGIAPEQGAGGGVVYPVTLEFVQVPADVRFRVGMTASVEIAVKRVDAETVVPARALLQRDGRDVVFAIRRDGERAVVAAVPVEIQALGTESAAVSSPDLAVGDEVLVAGFEDLEDGDPLP